MHTQPRTPSRPIPARELDTGAHLQQPTGGHSSGKWVGEAWSLHTRATAELGEERARAGSSTRCGAGAEAQMRSPAEIPRLQDASRGGSRDTQGRPTPARARGGQAGSGSARRGFTWAGESGRSQVGAAQRGEPRHRVAHCEVMGVCFVTVTPTLDRTKLLPRRPQLLCVAVPGAGGAGPWAQPTPIEEPHLSPTHSLAPVQGEACCPQWRLLGTGD